MKQSDFRIGNFIYGTANNLWIFSAAASVLTEEEIDAKLNYEIGEVNLGLLINGFDDEGNAKKVIRPIKLTEEWILKFDFTFSCNARYGRKYVYPRADWGFTIEPSFEDNTWFFGHEYYDSIIDEENYKSMHFCYNLKYVHQLQNIYHALTGEELILKDK